jgi:high-affinity iron transporter
MIENDSQNQNRLLAHRRLRSGWLLVVCATVACFSGAALAESPSEAAPAPAPASTSDDVRLQAQQLVALIDYVAADYPRAVDHGKVLIQSEFEEQQGLLRDAEELARSLPKSDFDAITPIQKLEAEVKQIAPGEQVAQGVASLHQELLERYEVASAPQALPSRSHGADLYATACATCHGLDGKANTENARDLNPKPARFDDAERMDKLSPFRAFNAVTFGAKGTSMPAYDVLSDADRWDLATYVFTLRGAPTDAERARADLVQAGLSFGPSKLATTTDGEVMARLTSHGLSADAAENALRYLRQVQAYRAPAATDLAAVRKGFEDAAHLYRKGQHQEAKRALISTYLDGFEPKEPALRARDADLVNEVEDAFVNLRATMESSGNNTTIAQREARLDALLERTEGNGPGRAAEQVAFWGSLIIVLREGLEAALLVATLLAVLKRAGRAEQAKAVHLGWTLALGLGVITWFVSGKLIEASGARREVLEGCVQLLTAAFLFYASHWLLARAHAQRWLGFIKTQAPARAGSSAVLGLSFLAVFREMFEVVVFYRGLLIETGGQTLMMWAGALAGSVLLLIAVLGFLRVGKRLPIGPFLFGCGMLLCALSVVMTGHGVRALQEADWFRLTPVDVPSVTVLGLYNSIEGLVAQGVLLVALVLSALWATHSAKVADKPVPSNNTPRPAAS